MVKQQERRGRAFKTESKPRTDPSARTLAAFRVNRMHAMMEEMNRKGRSDLTGRQLLVLHAKLLWWQAVLLRFMVVRFKQSGSKAKSKGMGGTVEDLSKEWL